MKHDRKKRYNAFITFVTLAVLAAELLPNVAEMCCCLGVWLYAVGGLICVACLLVWCIRHKAHWGIRYAVNHAVLISEIERALLEAGTGYSISGDEGYVDLPIVKVELSKDLIRGIVKIRNHIKYDSKLEAMNLSPSMGRYIVTNTYLSDDENWYIYEFADSIVDNQLIFNSYQEFAKYAHKFSDYQLFMDKQNVVPLSSFLLVGATGSGKTYALYSPIYQMINWKIKPELYFADPKNSSLCVLGKRISPQWTAGTPEEIITMLDKFGQCMEERKEELQSKLEEKLDADYRNWSLPAHTCFLDSTLR